MDNFAENAALKAVLGSFISSYAQRDTNEDFSVWLADRLCQEIPDMTAEDGERLAGEIMSAVAGYDKTLQDLNTSIEAGQTKEEWLSEQFAKGHEGMPPDAAGKALQRMEKGLVSTNRQLMGELSQSDAGGLPVGEAEPVVEWNKYSVKAKAASIGRQINVLALSAAANAMERNLQEGDPGGVSAVINDALRGRLKSAPGEVKAVVAGAVRATVEKRLTDTLPADTPIKVIGDLAGVAVEGADALCDAANGDISLTDALDKVVRAGAAAGCRIGAEFLRMRLMTLPGGLILVDLLGGLFEHLESSQSYSSVYSAVRSAAIATWEGIKKSKTVQSAKQFGEELFGKPDHREEYRNGGKIPVENAGRNDGQDVGGFAGAF